MRKSISLISLLAIIAVLAFSSWLPTNRSASAGQGKGGEVVAKPTPTPKKTTPKRSTPATSLINRGVLKTVTLPLPPAWDNPQGIDPPKDGATVRIPVTIDARGKVGEWAGGIGYGHPALLDEAQADADQQHFRPATRNGRPVKSVGWIDYVFTDHPQKTTSINPPSRTNSPEKRSPARPQPKPGTVVKNQIGMELVYVPAGSFMMGSTTETQKPSHRVTLGYGLYIGKYEVTQAQWQSVMSTTVRQQRDKKDVSLPMRGEGDSYPMYYVSWEEAKDFIQRLNALNDGYVYRLPTEAEWEYGCRAGTTGDYAGDLDLMAWYGNNSGNSYIDARSIWQSDRANYSKRIDNNENRTHVVGTKQANGFGLYDMHGNVWAWCEDSYHSTYDGAPSDGSAWLSDEQKFRILRGGSWREDTSSVRSSSRGINTPDNRGNGDYGFRVTAVARAH